MAKKKDPQNQVVEDKAKVNPDEIIVWKAIRPLTDQELEILSNTAKLEQEKSGIKIIVVPHSVEMSIETEELGDS